MSKAFTREENEGPDLPELSRRPSALPAGSTNYMTRAGADRLREELVRLIEVERPKLLALSSDPETKRRLAILDQRIFQLEQSLESAQVMSPPDSGDRVTFGATVTVRYRNGEQHIYRIVGVDEADADRGWISWRSPIARALINAKPGQQVRFESPDGEEIIEILQIGEE
jgi:transcription elongation factor GreB